MYLLTTEAAPIAPELICSGLSLTVKFWGSELVIVLILRARVILGRMAED